MLSLFEYEASATYTIHSNPMWCPPLKLDWDDLPIGHDNLETEA
jgi:hypothetical protein